MKSRTVLLNRTPTTESRPAGSMRPLPAIAAVPPGPDCDDECPFCHGPETD
jgi:hypothetical protein